MHVTRNLKGSVPKARGSDIVTQKNSFVFVRLFAWLEILFIVEKFIVFGQPVYLVLGQHVKGPSTHMPCKYTGTVPSVQFNAPNEQKLPAACTVLISYATKYCTKACSRDLSANTQCSRTERPKNISSQSFALFKTGLCSRACIGAVFFHSYKLH